MKAGFGESIITPPLGLELSVILMSGSLTAYSMICVLVPWWYLMMKVPWRLSLPTCYAFPTPMFWRCEEVAKRTGIPGEACTGSRYAYIPDQ